MCIYYIATQMYSMYTFLLMVEKYSSLVYANLFLLSLFVHVLVYLFVHM